jgi:TonB-linked SusC/RagA family outer membrane protein
MKKIYPKKWAYSLLSNLIPTKKMSCLFLATFLLVQSPLQARDSLTEIKVSVKANQLSVKSILREIEGQSGMKFIYLSNQVNERRKVSIEVYNAPLNSVLDSLFAGQGIVYEQLDRKILLKRMTSKTSSTQSVGDGLSGSYAFTITGKVTDESAEPLPGVNVVEKGTTNGTATDQNGDYSLVVENQETVLVFSFIGYASQEVSVGNQSQLNVTLLPDVQSLQEVVVVGYGTQKKVNLTGAVASVDGADIVKRPVTNAATMLQGRMPGVQIVQNSGEPGNEEVSIRVRGIGTFSNAGSDPLVLIDGVPGSLSNLNPTNIESISVLKDAASASIYGSRAANGVILVTTKTGKEGKVILEYSGNYAIHTPTKLFDLITNSAEYMELYNEARVNSGLTPDYTAGMIDTYRNATNRNLYPNTDWLDLMFNPAPTQMHNLNFSGGNHGTTFDVSLGYVNQEGVMKGFEYERYNIRLNLLSKVNDNIRFGANLALKKGKRTAPRQGATDTFIATMAQAPTYSPQLADGSGRYTNKAFPFEYNNKNPIAIIDNEANRHTDDYALQTQGWIDVTLVKGLSWHTKGAINLDFSKYDDFRPIVPLYNFTTNEPMGILDVGGAGLVIRDEQNVYKNIFTYLNFEHIFGDRHEVSAKVGYSAEDNVWQYLNGYRQDFASNVLRQLDAGSPSVQQVSGTKNEWALMSFFGRVGYNYDNRYLLEANLRYDGTSRLAPDSRWGAFPSFSAGWRISEEQFLKNLSLTWLDQLKIRGSYGQLGNQNIGLYPYQSILQLTSNYSFDNSNLSSGVAQTGLANQNIKWETTTAVDVGFDLTLFRGFDITFDWYKKRTADILRNSQVTAAVGLNPPTVNNGTMENTGVEVSLQYASRINSGYFSGLNYNLGFNIDHYKNELVDFGAREISGNSILEEGYEWNSYYMLEWIGIFQSADEIANSPKQFNDATVPGDLKFKDQDSDGDVDNEDRIHMSGRYPAFNYAFNVSSNWKGFDLSAQFQGVENVKYFVNRWGTIPFDQGSPPTTDWRGRWTETNPSTTMPRIYWGGSAPERISRNSSWFLQDGSYLRLKNLTFGYTLPSQWTERTRISQVRVYFSGDNLVTWTKYPGLDPERGSSGSFVNYPQNRIYSFGASVKF